MLLMVVFVVFIAYVVGVFIGDDKTINLYYFLAGSRHVRWRDGGLHRNDGRLQSA